MPAAIKPQRRRSRSSRRKTIPKKIPTWTIVQNYINHQYPDKLFIFTDGSKDPEAGRTGTAIFIPKFNIGIKNRTSNHLSVYAVEMMGIILALQWVEDSSQYKVTIATDSISTLTSVQSGNSCRQDLLLEISNQIYRLHNKGVDVSFLWVPAHVGVEGNEEADILAKQALKSNTINIEIPLRREEIKSIISKHMYKIWEDSWDSMNTGGHLYSIQLQVKNSEIQGRNRREEIIFARLRIGHTGLKHTLSKIGKHPTGLCSQCTRPETVQHVLLECSKHRDERQEVIQMLTKEKLKLTLRYLVHQKKGSSVLMKYLNDTGIG